MSDFVNSAAAYHFADAGRNLLHNGTFVVQQRGAGPWTASGSYTADRWIIYTSLDTASFNVTSLLDDDRAQIGDEGARYGLANTFTGNAGAAAYNVLQQHIEGLRRLANRTLTVSFWAWAGTAGLKLGVAAAQQFGTGGSPSAFVNITGTTVTLANAWTRYSVTLNVPSVAGKTFGTNGDDYFGLEFWYSSGATNNAHTGGVGVQSGAVILWGIQLEIGSVATPLDAGGSPQAILAECQRFYCVTGTRIDAATPPGAYGVSCSIALPVWMRASPTLTQTANASSNVSGIAYAAQNAGVVNVSGATGSGGGSYAIVVGFSASADL